MRKGLCCLVVACATAFGQNARETPAPNTADPVPNSADPNTAQSKALSEAFRRNIERMNLMNSQNPFRIQALPAIKPSVCATPLRQVTPPPNADKMRIQQTPEPRKGEVAPLPAPPCDDTVYSVPQLRIVPVNPVLAPFAPPSPKQ